MRTSPAPLLAILMLALATTASPTITSAGTAAVSEPDASLLPRFVDGPTLVSSAATWTCDEIAVDPLGDASFDNNCPLGGSIRPGVKGNGCTLSWIVTDGTDYWITTAGHCGGVGTSFSVPGVGTIGSVVFREFSGTVDTPRDWAFIKIDASKHSFIDPTMVHYGGPFSALPDLGDGPVRIPLPGDGVLHYGHGYGLGQEDATKGRAGINAATTPTSFIYPGTVGGGDSGSPVRLATGEAAGIAVMGGVIQTGDNRNYVPDHCAEIELIVPGACAPYWDTCDRLDGACDGIWRPNGLYGIVIATRLDVALDAFESWLGSDVWVLEGNLMGVTV